MDTNVTKYGTEGGYLYFVGNVLHVVDKEGKEVSLRLNHDTADKMKEAIFTNEE